jgi:hypothetical protein
MSRWFSEIAEATVALLVGGLTGKGVCNTHDNDGVHRSLLPVAVRDAAWRGPVASIRLLG